MRKHGGSFPDDFAKEVPSLAEVGSITPGRVVSHLRLKGISSTPIYVASLLMVVLFVFMQARTISLDQCFMDCKTMRKGLKLLETVHCCAFPFDSIFCACCTISQIVRLSVVKCVAGMRGGTTNSWRPV